MNRGIIILAGTKQEYIDFKGSFTVELNHRASMRVIGLWPQMTDIELQGFMINKETVLKVGTVYKYPKFIKRMFTGEYGRDKE